MHAFLLIGKVQEEIENAASALAKKHNARLIPFTLEKIADVRELSTMTKLTPSEKQAYYVEHIEEATVDAANAFLKQLEENEKTLYILTASSEDSVLGTIVSRCQVIRLTSETITKGDPIIAFIEKSSGEQLQIIDRIKKRDEAIHFVQTLISQLHKELIGKNTLVQSTISHHLTILQRTLTALMKNGNVTIQLTNMVVLLRQN
jgi:DNA polymerase III delta prime subunit